MEPFDPKKLSREELLETVRRCEGTGSLTYLARAYYGLGVLAMEQNEPETAKMYLGRASTIYSSNDIVFQTMGDALLADCSRRLSQLEEAPLLTNEIAAEVKEKAGTLEDGQVHLWSLFTLCRLGGVGARFAHVPGCEPFGLAGAVAEAVFRSRYRALTNQELAAFDRLKEWSYKLGDDPLFFGPHYAEGPCGPMQLFDLNGMEAIVELFLFLLDHKNHMEEGEAWENGPGLVPAALLPDYYLRCRGENLREVPQVRAELVRIRADYDFLRTAPQAGDIEARIKAYLALDILA